MVHININSILQKIGAKNYKLTAQRQIILQAFIDHQDEHLSAEDVYQIVHKQANDIGLATIYRTLELLSTLDVLQQMDFGDGRRRYEINVAGLHQHHHLICLSCGQVKEFTDDLLETLEAVIARESKFVIVDHQVKIYGYCQSCQITEERHC